MRPTSAATANYWHDGSLPGTASYLVRLGNGFSWAVIFNQRSDAAALPDNAIDAAMNTAIESVRSWPALDLFAGYP